MSKTELHKSFWEETLRSRDLRFIAGVDEAGRGAWAGPVVAAAVIFPPGYHHEEIDDSKKLKERVRESLFEVICREAVAYGIGRVESEDIDELNIHEASLEAMRQAVAHLNQAPDGLLIDGLYGIGLKIPQKTLVRGDSLSISIGAASILAKVTRDGIMANFEKAYPNFCFSRHKGYGTAEHLKEIKCYGILPIHRKSFEPIRSAVTCTA